MNRNIIILSSKSSGSTALQNYFIRNAGFSSATFTEHQEGETLFWTKVASVLQLKQDKMLNSVVPYSKKKALDSLNVFLSQNLEQEIFVQDSSDFHEFYNRLIIKYKNFVEKSPHHLFNWSNLKLIEGFYKNYSDKIDIKIIGLVRHPQDVIYSAWQRWGYDCNKFEDEWSHSYKNLLKFKEIVPLEIMRYEDLIDQKYCAIEKLGLNKIEENYSFKKGSVKKWKVDQTYGHQLNSETIKLAEQYGYNDFDNDSNELKWFLKSNSVLLKKKVYQIIKKFIR